jgi:hypothetical protein
VAKKVLTSKNIATQKKRPKIPLILLFGGLSVILILIIAICSVVFIGGRVMDKNQVALNEYLVEKYGGQFSIGEVKSESSGFNTLYLSASAVQKDKNIEFTVGKTQNGFFDTYHNALWSNEESSNINSIIHGFQYEYSFSSTLISINPSRSLEKQLGGNLPTYNETKSQNANEMTYGVDLRWNQGNLSYDATLVNLTRDLPALASYIDSQQLSKAYLGMTIDSTNGARYSCQLSSEQGSLLEQSKELNTCFKKVEE